MTIIRSQWQVNFKQIEKDLVDPETLGKEELLTRKEVEKQGLLKAVRDRNNDTYAIQVNTDEPALRYQTHFWNFWNIVRELREKYGVGHTESGAVYE